MEWQAVESWVGTRPSQAVLAVMWGFGRGLAVHVSSAHLGFSPSNLCTAQGMPVPIGLLLELGRRIRGWCLQGWLPSLGNGVPLAVTATIPHIPVFSVMRAGVGVPARRPLGVDTVPHGSENTRVRQLTRRRGSGLDREGPAGPAHLFCIQTHQAYNYCDDSYEPRIESLFMGHLG